MTVRRWATCRNMVLNKTSQTALIVLNIARLISCRAPKRFKKPGRKKVKYERLNLRPSVFSLCFSCVSLLEMCFPYASLKVFVRAIFIKMYRNVLLVISVKIQTLWILITEISVYLSWKLSLISKRTFITRETSEDSSCVHYAGPAGLKGTLWNIIPTLQRKTEDDKTYINDLSHFTVITVAEFSENKVSIWQSDEKLNESDIEKNDIFSHF